MIGLLIAVLVLLGTVEIFLMLGYQALDNKWFGIRRTTHKSKPDHRK